MIDDCGFTIAFTIFDFGLTIIRQSIVLSWLGDLEGCLYNFGRGRLRGATHRVARTFFAVGIRAGYIKLLQRSNIFVGVIED